MQACRRVSYDPELSLLASLLCSALLLNPSQTSASLESKCSLLPPVQHYPTPKGWDARTGLPQGFLSQLSEMGAAPAHSSPSPLGPLVTVPCSTPLGRHRLGGRGRDSMGRNSANRNIITLFSQMPQHPPPAGTLSLQPRSTLISYNQPSRLPPAKALIRSRPVRSALARVHVPVGSGSSWSIISALQDLTVPWLLCQPLQRAHA